MNDVDDEEENFDPYLGDGKTGKYFNKEWAILRLIKDEVLFANSFIYLYKSGGKENPETLMLFVSCNDLFYWATSDAEQLPMSELRTLYEMHIEDPKYGSAKWCCRRRKLRPQKPMEKIMREDGAWNDELELYPKPEPS